MFAHAEVYFPFLDESTECPVLGRCIAKQVERFASLGPQGREPPVTWCVDDGRKRGRCDARK